MKKYRLEKRIAELRQELAEVESELATLSGTVDFSNDIHLTDLIPLEQLQAMQDSFARATGVGSLITEVDGTPITKPSNFCKLCKMIRSTPQGRENCEKSDAILGNQLTAGPNIQPCSSGGLWDGGASISVGGKPIGNWLVGQIRNEYLDEDRMRSYARKIGADETDFMRALAEVTVMPLDRLKEIGKALHMTVNLLSLTAYENFQLRQKLSES